MPTDKIDIVMFNMSSYTEWQDGVDNRNCNVLHSLLQDSRVRKVVAVDYLPFTWKRALKQWWRNIMRGVDGEVLSHGLFHKFVAVRESEIERTGYRLAGYEPSVVPFKLFVYSDVSSRWSEAQVYRRLNRELARLDLKNVVLWSYLPTSIGYLGKLGAKLTVFDAVDNWLEHSSYAKVKERLKLNYQTLRYQADLIFTTSPEMVKFFDRPSGCTFVPNGVRVSEFEVAPKLAGRDMANLPRPIVGYWGIIQEDRFDVDLVAELARANPAKSFVLVGPVWKGLRQAVEAKLKPLSNVHLLGRKPCQERAFYLKEFNVGIIPHLQNEFTRHTNPMKLYEYLAAGKPVVATPGPGLEAFAGVVHFAATPQEFNHALLQALDETSEAETERRQTVAKEHAWEKRVGAMLEKVMAALNESS